MIITSWTLSNSNKNFTSYEDLLDDANAVLKTKFHDAHKIFKSAVDSNDIINQVLENIYTINDSFSVSEDFVSASRLQAQNFQSKLDVILKIYKDAGWTCKVETIEDIDLNILYMQKCADPLIVASNWVELVDKYNPGSLWGSEFPI